MHPAPLWLCLHADAVYADAACSGMQAACMYCSLCFCISEYQSVYSWYNDERSALLL